MTAAEIWSFLEQFTVQIVSMKCNYNMRDTVCDLCPNKQTNGANNHCLLGFAKEGEILFNDSEFEDEDGRTQIIEEEITDNENIDRMFELEVSETLASALDLLPDFLSIPIGEEQPKLSISNTTNIDECLQILKNIDMNASFINRNNKSNVIHKISEMRQIIERLQIKIIGGDEGYIENTESEYEYSIDNSDDASDIDIEPTHQSNITLMGNIFET